MYFFKNCIVTRGSDHTFVHFSFVHHFLVIFFLVLTFFIVLFGLFDIAQFLVALTLVVFGVVVFFVVAPWLVFVLALYFLLSVVVVGGRKGSFELSLLLAVVNLVF